MPAVAAKVRQTGEYNGCQLRFELWTTGELSPEAMAMVAARQAQVRSTKYTLGVRFGPDLHQDAMRHKRQPALAKVLEQHFLASPLSEVKMLVPAIALERPAEQHGFTSVGEAKPLSYAEVGTAVVALPAALPGFSSGN